MQRMRELLRGSLGRSLRALPDEDRLAAAWPVACGPALASHAEILHLDAEQVLHIRVIGPEWMQPFLQMRSALASDLGRIAGVPLSGIHFQEPAANLPKRQGSARARPSKPR
jgi:hypothetical protein